MRRYISIVSVSLALILMLLSPFNGSGAAPGPGPSLEQNGGPIPYVTDVNVTMKNQTGLFSFRFTVRGSSPSGTDHVNLTFVPGTREGIVINESEEGWISPGERMVFGNGYALRSLGNASEPWKMWSFVMAFSIPASQDPGQLAEMLGLMVGDLGWDISDLNGTIGNISMNETRMFLLARGFNDQGDWGQAAFDITEPLVKELTAFAEREGLLDDDKEPDDDDEDEGDDGGVGTDVLVILIIVSALSVVFLVMLLILWVRRRKEKRDRELTARRSRGPKTL